MISLPTLPIEQLNEMKTQFDALLRSTNRKGVEDLIAWLETTDFYTAPASASNHGAIEGGLLRHSLGVCKYLDNFLKPFKDEVPIESINIAALLHDLCKINFYAKRVRNVKIGKHWEEEESYYIDDSYPLGHGEKSVILAMKYIALTDDEALAIRWHMGGYDDAARAYASSRTQAAAYARSKLAVALNIADMYVANLIGH